jgi:2-polyprenyl-6-methoxyphenol hydroxylase-like FAD-dependent oxidoreductase
MMLGLLLAKAGVPTVLLEAHHDFDRDFRGDTVHPSTLEILDQLGLAERVLALPHGKLQKMEMHAPQGIVTMADLSRLRTKFPYIMMLPQVQLLELLAGEARRYPHFQLVLGASVQQLVEDSGTVRGVVYRDDEGGLHEVRAALTVAADGRFSKVRHLAGLEQLKTAPPMDVVWFRLPRQASDPAHGAEIHLGGGHFAILLERTDDWQIGYVILKGSFSKLKAAGIASVGQELAKLVPWLADRVGQLTDWKQVAVLNVESGRLPTWHQPGLLFLGDAAHTMSPVGGVGINMAIQDAVEAANLLAGKLRAGTVSDADLARVQQRREFAVRLTQRMQGAIQDRIAAPSLRPDQPLKLPWLVRIASAVPGLRDIPARLLAFGPRRVRIDARLLAADEAVRAA